MLLVAGQRVAACSSGGSTAETARATTGSNAAPSDTVSRPNRKPFGPLGPPDQNGLRLPDGFSSRVVAKSGEAVAGTGFTWHPNPDGGACFPAEGGGWIYVSNSETLNNGGGASMIRFSRGGEIVDARAILTGTNFNCAGGATPWGTWLSCEELPTGLVYECDPSGARPAEVRLALGSFTHEAVAVDPEGRALYMTEDIPDGGLYRFTPSSYPSLVAGKLEVMTESGGRTGWAEIPDPSAQRDPTSHQVPEMKHFDGGEGICHLSGAIYFTTKGDNRVWSYEISSGSLAVEYDAERQDGELRGVDNMAVSPRGEILVAEDGGDMQILQLAGPDVTPFPVVQVAGASESEVTGPAFSPDGSRLYFSSQRDPGTTYEVSGPW